MRSCGTCIACGWESENGKVYACSQRLECAHIQTRGWLSIRHHPRNVLSLCNIHHRYFTQHPKDWERFIESKWPGRMDWLCELRRDPEREPMEYWFDYWTEKLKEAA